MFLYIGRYGNRKNSVLLARKMLGDRSVPLFVVENQKPKRYRFKGNTKRYYDFIDCQNDFQELRKKWRPVGGYFGIDSEAELNCTINRIKRSYLVNREEDFEVGCDGSPDHDLLVETLRLRLLNNGSLVEDRFDRAMADSIALVSLSNNSFINDLEKVLNFNEACRKELRYGLDKDPRIVSYGDKIYGFAIDSETLMTATSSGFGSHRHAKSLLCNSIKEYSFLGGTRKDGLIFSGLVFPPCMELTTPLLALEVFYGQYISEPDFKAKVDRVTKHIIEKRWFIPVTFGGHPLYS